MINPRQQGEPLLHDPPAVFGKPWFWQRSSSTMESSRSLAQVIMEMRDEIKKLEAENRELRGDCGGERGGTTGETSAGTEQPAILENPENPYGNFRRNASAPVLEGQDKDNTAMTVRRYSTSSNISGLTVKEGRIDRNRQSNSGWDRLHQEIRRDNDVFGEAQEANNRHSLQEYVHKNRAKVKTVTFLLPVDDIYTSRPVLTKHQEEPKITGQFRWSKQADRFLSHLTKKLESLITFGHGNLCLVNREETHGLSEQRIRRTEMHIHNPKSDWRPEEDL